MRFQIPQSRSLEGHLLAASASMGDPRFRQAVILILHHGDQGALGIVLNRRINADEAKSDKQIQEFVKKGPLLFQGGPVGGSLIVLQLAKTADEEGSSSTGSIFMVQEPEQLKSIVASADGSVRVFLGHAGWKSGQLEEELAAGVWHLLTIQPDLLFSDGPQMWIEAIREVGCQFYRDVLKIPGFPADAMMN